MTLIVMLVILASGALYFLSTRPDHNITRAHPPLVETAATPPAAGASPAAG
jgi:hypothetical protein